MRAPGESAFRERFCVFSQKDGRLVYYESADAALVQVWAMLPSTLDLSSVMRASAGKPSYGIHIRI